MLVKVSRSIYYNKSINIISIRTDYVTWNGPDPDIRKGPTKLAKGPNPNISKSKGSRSLAKGPNGENHKGPRGLAMGSIFSQKKTNSTDSRTR